MVFRHWPLAYHVHAYSAARAVECAADQGGFVDFHRLLLSTTDWFDEPLGSFLELAEASGVKDLEVFGACIETRGPHPEIEADVSAARSFDARGTPAVLVNELYLGSVPFEPERLVDFIREALKGG